MPFKQIVYQIHTRLQSIYPVEKRSKALAFAFVAVGVAMDNLNVAGSMATMYSTLEHFHSTTTTVSWVLSAYALTLGAFIMLGGKLTDILGPDVVFISSLFITGLFALICAGIENQIIVLIVFRALQGITASFTIPSGFAIAGNYFEAKSLGNALVVLMAAYTSVLGFGFVIGGAFSVSSIGYKGIYYLTFALSVLISMILYIIHVPIAKPQAHKDTKLKYLDFGGSALFVIGILLITLGLTEGGDSWKKPSAYIPLPVGVLVLVGAFVFELVIIQNRKDRVDSRADAKGQDSYLYKVHMLIPREMMFLPNFFPFVICTLLAFIYFIMMVSGLTQYHQYVEGDSPLITGVKILPLSIGLCLLAILNLETLFYRIGMKAVLIFSQVVAVFMLLWMSRQRYDSLHGYWVYELVPLFLFGAAINIYYSIYINAMLRRTPVHLQGVTSGFLQTIGQVGICIGNALTATVLGEIEIATTSDERERMQSKIDNIFYITLACSAAATITLFFISDQKSADGAPSDESVEEVQASCDSKELQV